jgi:ribosomal protein S27E
MIRFLCPEGGKHLKAPISYLGKQVKCTRCGRTLQTPGVSDPKTVGSNYSA